jgi:hypothetical protein
MGLTTGVLRHSEVYGTRIVFISNAILECLKNGEEMTGLEILAAIKKRYPYIHIKYPRWQNSISKLLVGRRLSKIYPCGERALEHLNPKFSGPKYLATKIWRISEMYTESIKNLIIIGPVKSECENCPPPPVLSSVHSSEYVSLFLF